MKGFPKFPDADRVINPRVVAIIKHLLGKGKGIILVHAVVVFVGKLFSENEKSLSKGTIDHVIEVGKELAQALRKRCTSQVGTCRKLGSSRHECQVHPWRNPLQCILAMC